MLRHLPKLGHLLGYEYVKINQRVLAMVATFVLHCKFPSPLFISHKIWVVLIDWNSSCLFNTSNTRGAGGTGKKRRNYV